ncbi:efflux RND transporter permease subunit [Marinitoga litoralis]|uniref:efflux RND transporter permease subunit n=1 Tax=Marinitoga litoralis TaxID=570855 RepID=UPI0019606E12|nr:MMPL family transporter [Marinitoga litoralis]MBM7558569.1 putative RND superfamily exporter protein [Marinitoga litoralis]
MERYVEFVFNNRKKLLILLVIINITALIGLFQIRLNVDMKAFLPSSSEYLDSYSIIEKKYDLSDQLMVMLETDKNPLEDLELYRKLWSLQRELENIEGINFISSLFPQSFPGYNIKSPEDINENFLNKISQISMFKDKFFKEKDGKYYTLLTIPLKTDDFKVIDIIEEVLKDVTHYNGGTLYFTKKLFDYLLSIVIFLPPFAFLTMLLIFSLQLGSKKLALFSVIPAGLGALWTLGLMGWSGRELSLASVLVPIFTIIMGSADGMHFLTHYVEYIERGLDKKSATVETLKSTGIAMIMTTVTTIIGFISMVFINSNMMREMGLWTSFGIGFAGIATLYILPVIIAGNIELKRKKAHMFDASFLKRFWNKKGVFTYIVLILIFALLIPTITVKFDQISMFKKYTKVRKDYEKLTSVFDFNIPIMVDFQTTKDPLDKTYLDEMKILENELEDSISMFNYPQQFLDVMGREFFNFKSYPNSIQVLIIKNAVKNNPSIPLFDLIEGKSYLGIITTKDNNQGTLEKIQKVVSNLKNDDVFTDIKVSGMPYVFNEMNTTVLNSQIKSIIISLILVFISIFVMIRSLKISFYGILPLLGALIAEFGVMALFKIPLNIQSALMANITIGVGVDYAIHMIGTYRYYKTRSENPIEETFNVVQKPILANAIGLALGLSILNFSPFTFHSYLSIIMWVGMISASMFTLMLLPNFFKEKRGS